MVKHNKLRKETDTQILKLIQCYKETAMLFDNEKERTCGTSRGTHRCPYRRVRSHRALVASQAAAVVVAARAAVEAAVQRQRVTHDRTRARGTHRGVHVRARPCPEVVGVSARGAVPAVVQARAAVAIRVGVRA